MALGREILEHDEDNRNDNTKIQDTKQLYCRIHIGCIQIKQPTVTTLYYIVLHDIQKRFVLAGVLYENQLNIYIYIT